MSNYKKRALNLFQQSILAYTNSQKSYNETQNDRWIIECIYPGKRNGYFLEAGAADGQLASSCYLLEFHWGWKGICVEPHDEFFQRLVKNRPNSICEKVCLSAQSGSVSFIEGDNEKANPYLSGIKSNLEQFKHQGKEIIKHGREVIKEAMTLEELLRKHHAPKIIDYAAFDIEGSEFEVLKHFPFNEYQFSALSLECDGYIWDAITDLLTVNGYHEVKNPFNPDKTWERYWLHESLAI